MSDSFIFAGLGARSGSGSGSGPGVELVTLAFRISVDVLSDAIEALQTVVVESRLQFTAEGMSSRAVGPANVAMVDITVPADAFERLDPSDSRLGINLDTLADAVDMAQSDDDVIAETNKNRKLELQFPETGLEYTMALIDPDSIRKEPDIPKLDLDATYTMPGRAYDRGIDAADLVSDHILFRGIDSDSVMLRAEGDVDDVSFTVTSEEGLIEGDTSTENPVDSLFSLEYLDDMFDPVSSDTPVSMELGSEFPMILRYTSATNIQVKNVVAPRVSQN